jgi:hypothetical protein
LEGRLATLQNLADLTADVGIFEAAAFVADSATRPADADRRTLAAKILFLAQDSMQARSAT